MLQTVEVSIENKYNNFSCGRKLLMLKLGELKSNQLDLLYGLLAIAKKEKSDTVNISINDVMSVARRKSRKANLVSKELNDLSTKVNLFETFVVDKKEVHFRLKSHVKCELNKDEVSVSLDELTSLSSKYSKMIYILLRVAPNYIEMDMDDFRNHLSIPPSFKMSKVDSRVLKPALEELKSIYNFLSIYKIKHEGTNEIKRIRFTY